MPPTPDQALASALSNAHTIWLMGVRRGIKLEGADELDPLWEADLATLRANGGFENLSPS